MVTADPESGRRTGLVLRSMISGVSVLRTWLMATPRKPDSGRTLGHWAADSAGSGSCSGAILAAPSRLSLIQRVEWLILRIHSVKYSPFGR